MILPLRCRFLLVFPYTAWRAPGKAATAFADPAFMR